MHLASQPLAANWICNDSPSSEFSSLFGKTSRQWRCLEPDTIALGIAQRASLFGGTKFRLSLQCHRSSELCRRSDSLRCCWFSIWKFQTNSFHILKMICIFKSICLESQNSVLSKLRDKCSVFDWPIVWSIRYSYWLNSIEFKNWNHLVVCDSGTRWQAPTIPEQ